jgi:hypothetical protein
MYRCGITAKEMIESVKSETDIVVPISDFRLSSWINAVEQTLYSDIINDMRKVSVTPTDGNTINISVIAHPDTESGIRYEDIFKVVADGEELLPVTLISSEAILTNRYWEDGDTIRYDYYEGTIPNSIEIIYTARPRLKSESTLGDELCIPNEFSELIASRLRGEMYKLANNDALSKKWLDTYNAYLEDFKVWVAVKKERIYGE